MSHKLSRRILALGVSLAVLPLVVPGVAAADPAIAPIDLGTLPGDQYSEVNAVNDAGVMVGSSTPLEGQIKYHAAKWDAQGRISALPGLGGEQSKATDVNRDGVAVGWAHKDAAWNQAAVKWSPGGAVTALPYLPGGDYAIANAITDGGVIVGAGRAADGTMHAVRWNPDGKVVDLGGLPSGAYSSAEWITPDGRTIAGTATDSAGNNHVVRWDLAGTITDLSPGNPNSTPEDMNDFGVIVGSADVNGEPKPVRWERDGRMTSLDWPERDPGWARAVNNAGVAAGGGYLVFGTTSPVKWNRAGTRTTLSAESGLGNDIDRAGTVVGLENGIAAKWDAAGTRTVLGVLPGGDYSTATHITANGTIVGLSYNENKRSHAVYWPAK
ncbi:hypothetical protein GCM10027598_29800 [Amycolatopsis oliviviridis]|uniref:Extracellular repeat, HAF family n=1 Tax=Amycolatopsis oliviviridis TaxID=1471590 RepID=A0ABQ3LVB6_9PSEU|nr:hypothetical protein [Amycolatopsis oliviviridis]GHH25034.1 hypothetical protein GCM10017790_50350 [Amycolatopsis oliviviridis]